MTLLKHIGIMIVLGAFVAYSVASCGDDDTRDDNGTVDGDTDADADTDTDADADTDTDSDTDADAVEGELITPSSDGWLDTSANTLGLQGAWYTFGCDDATVTPAEGSQFALDNGRMCFSGTAPKVTDADNDGKLDWSDIWGAGMGFDLCAEGGDSTVKHPLGDCPLPGNAAASMTGVSVKFAAGGTVNAEHLRIQFNEGDSVANSYYIVDPAAVAAGEVVTVRFESDDVATWYDTGAKPDGAVQANILAVQFQVPTNQETAVDWNFCVEAVGALTD